MFSSLWVSTVLVVVSATGLGFLVATVGGGTLAMSVLVMRYLLRLRNVGHLFATSTAVTTAMAFTLLFVRRQPFRPLWRPALWFTMPGILAMAAGHALHHGLSGHLRLALLGLLMLLNVLFTMILPKALRPTKRLTLRTTAAGTIVGLIAGLFGGGGGFLTFPALLWSGLPAASATGSSLLSVTVFSGVATIHNLGRCAIDWHIIPLYLISALAGMSSGIWFGKRQQARRSRLSMQWIASGLMLLGGLYLLQHNWSSLYRPSLALYDGLKGGFDYEFTN
ncbi:hypothetical protein BXT84_12500 [Sulfobacillus thermotolerans]|uniref:Probable membrane transporter protein n=1 Tax=Sulfobacillus thermotolerans TaxID=338644 RepID=A0ABN5H1V6_9FIRM|nr:hypothetical protein BXT84_12500 [Sulfobacillus thermotolerans]